MPQIGHRRAHRLRPGRQAQLQLSGRLLSGRRATGRGPGPAAPARPRRRRRQAAHSPLDRARPGDRARREALGEVHDCACPRRLVRDGGHWEQASELWPTYCLRNGPVWRYVNGNPSNCSGNCRRTAGSSVFDVDGQGCFAGVIGFDVQAAYARSPEQVGRVAFLERVDFVERCHEPISCAVRRCPRYAR